MALTVEDGSIVAGADSLTSLTDARAWVAARGLALPSADADAESALRRGMDYVNSYRARYQGSKVSSAQATQFPRYNLYIDGVLFAYDEVPQEAIAAQILAAVEYGAGTDLLPSGTPSVVKREKVGPLETEYATEGGRGSTRPRSYAIEAMLSPLLRSGGSISTVRA